MATRLLGREFVSMDLLLQKSRSKSKALAQMSARDSAVIILMLMVPGVFASTKVWMLSLAGVGAVISLIIGLWNFADSDAPVMVGFPGALMAVALLVELAECVASVFQLVLRTH